MKLDKLTPTQRKAWTEVVAYKRENPDDSVSAALKATGNTSINYYLARVALNGGKLRGGERKRKYTKRIIMHTLPVAEAHTPVTSRMIALIGSPQEVVASLKEIMQ